MCSILVLIVVASPLRMCSQSTSATDQKTPSYRLSIPVDEVTLTFHAADANGLAVNDLKLQDLSILDDGRPPRKIDNFEPPQQDIPIRAGILIDTSESMQDHLTAGKIIAIRYAQGVLREQTDKAFVTAFGYISNVMQPWTNDPAALTMGIRKVVAGRANPVGGTAIFNAIWQACQSQFGNIGHAGTGNFILLFSDGEDNTGLTSLNQAVDACQQTNTAIYAFRADTEFSSSSGPKTLAELASQTGGRVFHEDDSVDQIYKDLRIIDADLRSQYRLAYRPAELKHNGSFHRIELKAPERADTISVRSGYYAPSN